MKSKALEVLRKVFGYQDFRPMQEEIVLSVSSGKDTLALLPTGGGKSLCFQVPGLMQEGLCLVVSPLIALMKDQVDNLRKKGINAVAVYSGMRKREIDTLLDNCVYGDVKFLYVSPERLQTEIFLARFKKMKLSLIAVDEAHCISQWGYDFRPPYLEIAKLRETHAKVPFIALTASATLEVRKDIMEKLEMREPRVFVQSFARPNLSFVVRKSENKLEKAVEILQKVPGAAIIYARNRRGTKEISDHLQRLGISSTFYHAGLEGKVRTTRQSEWIQGKQRVMVATNAFGMGIDKPDVRVVLHLDLPENLENYYQEAGRAGRDGKKSFAVLIYQEMDREKLLEKAEKSYPPIELIKRVYQCLANFYRLAVGSNQMSSFDFDIHHFTRTYQLDPLLSYNALKVLEEETMVLLSESVHNPSTLHVLVDSTRLYETQIRFERLDPLIKLLLRMHGGELFASYVIIAESKLATALRITELEVEKMLMQLDELGVMAYHPRKNKPQVTFLTPRMDAGKLPLDTKRIASRRDLAVKKARSMVAYAVNDKLCRTLQVLEYFGEESEQPCGICDVCLNNRNSGGEFERRKIIRQRFLKTLDGGEAFSLLKLFEASGLKKDEVTVEELRCMEDEGLIETGKDGWIKRKLNELY
ncbi:RecQ family ATP-dependent DNA helicase [Pleomorphovibrio marinus]|uniref:RecQ family ATP-dependent DNA helicase n=1 Tax=Pleomorphovibrio marinus TaxID=2164132 RepID=UPI000E0B945D|nr:ATP-dependent DNA helicase RecQ [Pleomorphovibrio marinus]